MIVLRELAPAKINLYLHITGKRSDGYHLLDSLVAFADVHDKVEVTPCNTVTLAVEGDYASKVPPADNTVLKAALALQKQYKVAAGAALVLHKNIPVGAGMGGGSADAAATLRLLSRFWRIQPTPKDLHTIALSIGADVPACLRSGSLYMSSIGEVIEPGPVLSGLTLLLINQGKALLTSKVFAEYKGSFSSAPRKPHMFSSPSECIDFLQKTKNDLQAPASKLVPEIKDTLNALGTEKECLLSRMTGSGATCFGIFTDSQIAEKVAEKLNKAHPAWWIKTAAIR